MSPPHNPEVRESLTRDFVRLGWMLFGFQSILLMAFLIVQYPTWTLSWRDALFWFAVASTAGLRYLDVVFFQGETAGGHPASLRDLRMYLLGLGLISGLVWTFAQSVHL